VSEFGDYVVYVDESGDQSLTSIDPEYPVFVLAFCIFPVDSYIDSVVPRVQRFKFRFFGHDMAILHEHEIRKSKPPFDILMDAAVREPFMEELSSIVREERFGIVAAVIDKQRFTQRRGAATNPYHVALEFGLERVFLQLQQREQRGKRIRVIFESRGKTEDRALELEFRRIMSVTRMRGMADTLDFMIASKQCNSAGLQVADMVARPIGIHVLRPEQSNRAWENLCNHVVKSPSGEMRGYGLKIYP